jgi:hypothetical protein
MVPEVERIARLQDAVIRNLQITQCYHELTATLGSRIVGDANWCTFATWASKQAGQTIRGQDLSRALEHRFDQSPVVGAGLQAVATQLRRLGTRLDVPELRQVLKDMVDPAAMVARASDAVARGNLKVFEEIGREFARFIALCIDDPAHDAGKIERFCSELRAGEPPEGQRYLRQAFMNYYLALFEPDGNRRAELLLLANLEVGFHEQSRLQPQILEALNVAIPDPDQLTSRLIAAVLPQQASLIQRARRFLRRLLGGSTPLDDAVSVLVEQLRREVRLVLTDHLMTLTLARGVILNLGTDLRSQFPATLSRIEHTALTELLQRIDPTPDSLRESGATDWGDLSERMHFIADLFRCYHTSRDLFDPPFTPEQVAALKAGRVPAGRL